MTDDHEPPPPPPPRRSAPLRLRHLPHSSCRRPLHPRRHHLSARRLRLPASTAATASAPCHRRRSQTRPKGRPPPRQPDPAEPLPAVPSPRSRSALLRSRSRRSAPPPAEPVEVPDPPPTAETRSLSDADTHGFGAAMGRLMGGSRRTARGAALVAASHLAPNETVEIVVCGRFLANDAVAVLTNTRLIVANDRQWDPEIVSLDNLVGLKVEGWVERRSATLRLTHGTDTHVVDRINDTAVAEALADALRARAS